jgi:hypothetical protein
MKGSNNNSHSVINGELYFSKDDGYVIGYLKANTGCYLTHKEHGVIKKGQLLREAKIKSGYYQLRCQMEHTNESMKQVID